MTIGADRFRQVMGRYPTGVTVVTTAEAGTPHGITVSSFTSVSLDPPMVLVALAHRRSITPVIRRAGRFAVNVLGADGADLAACFAGDPVESRPARDAFCGVAWHPGESGLPLLDAAIATIECSVVSETHAGDHTLCVGRVLTLADDRTGRAPLVFHRRRYGRLAAEEDSL